MIVLFDLDRDCKEGTTLEQAGTAFLGSRAKRKLVLEARAAAILTYDHFRVIKQRNDGMLLGIYPIHRLPELV